MAQHSRVDAADVTQKQAFSWRSSQAERKLVPPNQLDEAGKRIFAAYPDYAMGA
jgi:hypothetical protein